MKSFRIYHSVANLPPSWDGVVEHDIFLQTSYLKAVEEASPNNIQFFFVGIFNDDVLVGVAIIQRVQLYLKDMFRAINVSCVKEFFRDVVSKVLKGNVLVVGNLTHTGQHGVFFQKENITQATYLELVYKALEAIKNHIKTNQNKTIRAIMFKDYFLDDTIHLETNFFNTNKLHKVTVQPNMVLKIEANWLSFNDYLNELNKKYKSRYKTARKKLNGITCSELDLEAIKTNSNRLHALYLNVSNNAKFNTFILPENHFYSLKRYLQDNFKVFGYYLDEELIGFFTLIQNEQHLETYFLGYDEAHQYKNQLYLNMLYSMLEFGIINHFETIVYARTAMEIKSSVGAKAKPMFVYMKHTNSFMNAVLKQLFGLMNPKQDWEERHPFKS
ncbi:GNAT family N-acetyltransferase [Mariniflexile gromovii]|uniref:GNAT family N-acetyltransferase n=1 Tax=Mariniflexile gromovii TaxID=362523 RepID=A0ABS4BQU4_9FLAO|nr:GNAT family N-acetyltransferase [Mariniflexile gromovii]MBP0902887.1 GNAT family N-acetyltransferase [Mariniflexile gromovii]